MHESEAVVVTNSQAEVKTNIRGLISCSKAANRHYQKTSSHSWRSESAEQKGSPVESVSSIRYPRIPRARFSAGFYENRRWQRIKTGKQGQSYEDV